VNVEEAVVDGLQLDGDVKAVALRRAATEAGH
jgi:hypothetical protein